MRSFVQISMLGSWRARLLFFVCLSTGCVLPKLGFVDESASQASSSGMRVDDGATQSVGVVDGGEVTQSSADPHSETSTPVSDEAGQEAGVGGAAANAQMDASARANADAGTISPAKSMDGGSVSNGSGGSAGNASSMQSAPQPNAHCGRTGDTACFGSYQFLTCDGQSWSKPQTCAGGGDCFPDASVNGAGCRAAVKECEGVSSGTAVCTVTAALYQCEGGGIGTFARQCVDPYPTCSAGSCMCPGFICGERCVHLDSDASNCGTCGHDCGKAPCFNGKCVTTNGN